MSCANYDDRNNNFGWRLIMMLILMMEVVSSKFSPRIADSCHVVLVKTAAVDVE